MRPSAAFILLRRADGTLAEGIVDLIFHEETSGLHRLDRGGRALYVEAIEKATNLPARGILVVV